MLLWCSSDRIWHILWFCSQVDLMYSFKGTVTCIFSCFAHWWTCNTEILFHTIFTLTILKYVSLTLSFLIQVLSTDLPCRSTLAWGLWENDGGRCVLPQWHIQLNARLNVPHPYLWCFTLTGLQNGHFQGMRYLPMHRHNGYSSVSLFDLHCMSL